MNENLNLVEILKDCPKGAKLYSTMFGEVDFDNIENDSTYPIIIKSKYYGIDRLSIDGKRFIDCGECILFPSKEQRDWSKFKVKKPKFDPKTLQPFDKVLIRDTYRDNWNCDFFSHELDENTVYKYVTIKYGYKHCIPYNEDTKHLVGTTEEAPEFYRYWED